MRAGVYQMREGLTLEPLHARGAVKRGAYRGQRLMPMSEYLYELRRGDEVVATGRLSRDDRVEVGDRVLIGGWEGIVRAVVPLLGERELRLVVQLVRDRG